MSRDIRERIFTHPHMTHARYIIPIPMPVGYIVHNHRGPPVGTTVNIHPFAIAGQIGIAHRRFADNHLFRLRTRSFGKQARALVVPGIEGVGFVAIKRRGFGRQEARIYPHAHTFRCHSVAAVVRAHQYLTPAHRDRSRTGHVNIHTRHSVNADIKGGHRRGEYKPAATTGQPLNIK